ncbi:ankyrin repeat domain-containing protein 65 [Diplodia corticola]|uniref:Ankyrin repeat domain-containing protein 65 n=1 Tax=Diplodia corticola TaxID=236234 RepID=A0A1J9QNI7_9PEZI|nr:ankyrin repeat domain-containing protein 65 [Diplodia corticola]OJD30024.1 ankyrin repeat domain-containing protein 65 [Diplodia corticola]
MKFNTAAAAALLSASALAAPAAIEVDSGTPSATYKIKDFTTRKYDGRNIDIVSFKIAAFNGETLSECSSTNDESFVVNQRYTCDNSRFSFTYVDYYDWVKPTVLTIREETTRSEVIGGSTSFITPPCRAGGSNPNDLVCQLPDSHEVETAASNSFSYQLLRTAIRQYPKDRTLRLIRKTPQHVIAAPPADGRQCPLHTACQVLDADIVEALLEKGADANVRTADGETPLHCALSSVAPRKAAFKPIRLKIVTMLLAAGASVSAVDEDRNSALHLAILYGYIDCARVMLARDDFALSIPNKRGEIPLFVSGTDQRSAATPMDMAEFLTRWHILNRPLHRAVASGDVSAVHQALDAGEDVSARSMLGDAAIHLAALRGDANMVSFLLSKGACGSQAGYLGQTALHRAATACGPPDHAHGIDAPVQKSWTDPETALFRAVSEYRQHSGNAPSTSPQHLTVAQILLDGAGLTPNIPDALLRTPLHLAAGAGNEPIAQLLLSHAADPTAPDVDLRTPLWHAASSNNISLLSTLLHHGGTAALHLRPSPLRDVGHLAVRCGRRCVTPAMLHGTSTSTTDGDGDARGRTPLIHAVQEGALAPTQHLLDAGAYVGQQLGGSGQGGHGGGKGSGGWSPLVQACDRRRWEVARVLLEAGADVREREGEGRTVGGGGGANMALHLAARGGSVEVVGRVLRAETRGDQEQQSAERERERERERDQRDQRERPAGPSRRSSVQSFRSTITMQSTWSGATKVVNPVGKQIGFYRWTPLHYAAGMGHRGVVCMLLGIMERMEIIARDIDGFTAQELAKGAGYEEIDRLIEERLG